MRISTQTDFLAEAFGIREAIRMIAAAGFDAVDLSLFDISDKNPLFAPGWEAYIDELKQIAADAGVVCNQAHAPFPSRHTEDKAHAAYNERIFDLITRSVEGAARLGASVIVVHPIQNLVYWKRDNARRLFDVNMDFYRALAPVARRAGIRIAVENMWQVKDGHICDSTCASPEEFAAYLDTLADDCFTGCLDLGHCGLCGRPAEDVIRALGASHIGALHIHDNTGLDDSHTLPYNGVMNWNNITAALGEIGYPGDFTYEADSYLYAVPRELVPTALRYMLDIAAALVKKIDAAR